MLKQCTPELIRELSDIVLNDGLTSLTISKFEDGSYYYASYTIATEPLTNVSMARKLYFSSILLEFASMLMIDKVHEFALYLEPGIDKCVVNRSYNISSEEISRDIILKQIIDKLNSVMTMSQEISVSELKINDIYEKVSTTTSTEPISNNQKNRTDSRPRYKEATLNSVIAKVLGVIN